MALLLSLVGTKAQNDNPQQLADSVIYDGTVAMIVSSKNITTCIIKEGTTRIGKNCFRDCKKLESIFIPSSVTSIGEEAFYGCDKLAYVHISDIAAWCKIIFEPG